MDEQQQNPQATLTPSQQHMLDVDARIAAERQVEFSYATGQQPLLHGNIVPISSEQSASSSGKTPKLRIILISIGVVVFLVGSVVAFANQGKKTPTSDITATPIAVDGSQSGDQPIGPAATIAEEETEDTEVIPDSETIQQDSLDIISAPSDDSPVAPLLTQTPKTNPSVQPAPAPSPPPTPAPAPAPAPTPSPTPAPPPSPTGPTPTTAKITTTPYSCNLSSPPLIQSGSTGNCVKAAQWILNKWIAYKKVGISPLTVDGAFGAKTKDATLRFQRMYNLTADGIIGSKTWSKLTSGCNVTVTCVK